MTVSYLQQVVFDDNDVLVKDSDVSAIKRHYLIDGLFRKYITTKWLEYPERYYKVVPMEMKMHISSDEKVLFDEIVRFLEANALDVPYTDILFDNIKDQDGNVIEKAKIVKVYNNAFVIKPDNGTCDNHQITVFFVIRQTDPGDNVQYADQYMKSYLHAKQSGATS